MSQILVIDDSEDFARMLSERLEEAGLAEARRCPPSLILLDWHLDAARRPGSLRALSRGAGDEDGRGDVDVRHAARAVR